MREARVNDRYTAELAAWCAEIHEHLRELAGALGIELLLMGGNGASLRFDAVAQRGSRDNDYLTAATPQNIGRLMDSLGQRFLALGGLMQPRPFEPKRPVRALPLKTYVVPVPLLLNHGHSTNNEVKVEFHFERRLPPAETVTGTLGPAATPSITAELPELPYQVGIKLMTLASDPVGIDESTRAAAVPRQMYDLDLLLAGLERRNWAALAEYTRERYAEECELWDTEVQADEPFTGIRTRLERWGDCLDETATRWHVIRAARTVGPAARGAPSILGMARTRVPAHHRDGSAQARRRRLGRLEDSTRGRGPSACELRAILPPSARAARRRVGGPAPRRAKRLRLAGTASRR